MNRYENILRFFIKELMIDETNYEIDIIEEGRNLLLNVSIKKEQIGKLIGRNGNTITSIRNLVNSISKKDRKNVKIVVKDI